MATFHRFVRSTAFVLLSLSICYADVSSTDPQGADSKNNQAIEQPSSWLDRLWSLPVLNWFAPLFESMPVPQAGAPSEPETTVAATAEPLEPLQPAESCSVAALDAIEDPAALQLEASAGTLNVVDVSGMVPAAERALGRFQASVEQAGGTIFLKSAYRPAPYQQHLQNVWYKWMDELRNNAEPGCQALKAQVQDEFLKHRLIETQHPVAVSDHTRGLAFDATVALPTHARMGRRRATLDSLAHLAGLIRPAIAADPVHFKFVGALAPRHTRRSRNA